jgi:hypothetical protein
MTKSHLILATLLSLGAAVHAADAPAPQASQAVAVAASAASAPTVVCHRETPVGSTIAVKVCRTVDPEADARNVDDVQRRIQHDSAMAAQQRIKSQ